MGLIDVSDLLTDPDMVDKVTQIKVSTRVDGRGKNQTYEDKIETVGCVVPASGKTIFRLPEEMRVADVSEFFIKGKITAIAPGKYTDVLVFKGYRYEVQTVFDYTNWGAGYCQGTCIKEIPGAVL